jgi:hypothetical protein
MLLRRSALGLGNGVSSGSRVGAAWHYKGGKGFSLQLDLLPAQLRPAQKLRVLSSQAATGTTPQALSAMNA